MADNTYSKMLEHLGELIAFEETLDLVKVDPAPDLTPAALTDLRTLATELHTAVGNAKGDWRTATLDRTTDADMLASKASKAVAAFESRGASKEKIEQARFYVRKLQGKRAGEAAVDDPSTPDVDESEKSISASQQSNAARISIFYELIDFLEAQVEYASVNNPELKISALRAFADSVQAKHDTSITTASTLSSGRIARDKVFFDNADSIVNRAKRLKKAVGAAYGFDSPEYKTINAIQFSDRR
jgi:hypothetical protein